MKNNGDYGVFHSVVFCQILNHYNMAFLNIAAYDTSCVSL